MHHKYQTVRVRIHIQMHDDTQIFECCCCLLYEYMRACMVVVVGYCVLTAKTRAIYMYVYSCIELSSILSNFMANTLALCVRQAQQI